MKLRYGIISDIHSNIEALTSVLAKLDKEKVNSILCLGDLVGYGPNPNECVAAVKENCSDVILGNHDLACLNESEIQYFNRFASDAIYWTINNLSDFNFEFISQLPIQKQIENFIIVHSSPKDPFEWNYITNINQAIDTFDYFKSQISFIGHTHVPITFVENEKKECYTKYDELIKLDDNERYIINVGSVGQSRDSNPQASCGIIDTDKKEFQLIRVTYDVAITQKKMLEQKLPYFLVERLANGR